MSKKTSKPKAKTIKTADAAPAAPEQAQSVDAPDAPTEPVVPAAPAEPFKQPKAPCAPKDQRNGVTRPGLGKCLDVWTHLDALKAASEKLTFEALRLRIDPSTADATLRTQWTRWRKYNG
jgi:hypothetical protein